MPPTLLRLILLLTTLCAAITRMAPLTRAHFLANTPLRATLARTLAIPTPAPVARATTPTRQRPVRTCDGITTPQARRAIPCAAINRKKTQANRDTEKKSFLLPVSVPLWSNLLLRAAAPTHAQLVTI